MNIKAKSAYSDEPCRRAPKHPISDKQLYFSQILGGSNIVSPLRAKVKHNHLLNTQTTF
jgi:hypothetical protein